MASFFITIIIISILILVHELGHFLAARANRIRVEEFGIGYPPRVWFKKVKGMIFSLNALPFGGFVRLLGEEERETVKPNERAYAFSAQPRWRKATVILAGVVGNFLLGALCFAVIYTKIGIPEKVDYLTVQYTAQGSPAQKAGIEAGDRIGAINGEPVDSLDRFMSVVKDADGQPLTISLTGKQGAKDVIVTPRRDPPQGEGALGVAITDVDNIFYPLWQMPWRGAWYGLQEAWAWGGAIVSGLILSVRQLVSGVIPEVAGPVRIFGMANSIAQEGKIMLLHFMAVLSINLAVLNILPIPALDGGRLVFILLDRFIRREKRAQIESSVNAVGMAFLLTLMVLVTVNDLVWIYQSNPFWQNLADKIWPF